MLKSRNQPICSGQGIIRHHLAKNWIRFFLCHFTRVTIHVSLKDHHHFFPPHSIFNLYQLFISNCWANDSDVRFRNDSHLPSNLFQPPFWLCRRCDSSWTLPYHLSESKFRFQERCDMTWHLLCAFVLMICVMYHVFVVICYAMIFVIYALIFVIIMFMIQWCFYSDLRFNSWYKWLTLWDRVFSQGVFSLICLISMEHVT